MQDLWTTLVEEFEHQTPKSRKLFERAQSYLPGGISRATVFLRPHPIYAARAHGSRITDVDGNERIDLCNNFGPLILGHNHPKVLSAVQNQLELGDVFGSGTELEIKLAEKICQAVPSAEQVGFCISGSEATMRAIRLARAHTGRRKIAKFEGIYNGSADFLEVSVKPPMDAVGSPASPNPVSDSAGITQGVLDDIIVLPWNDPANTSRIVNENKDDLAGIIVNPIGRVNPPRDDFLRILRELTEKTGSLLIFDEVITGFRLARGGAQEYYGVVPDIATYGKIVGGGYPAGAVASSREIMSFFDPSRTSQPSIPTPGTNNGHPISMAAGLATLGELTSDVYSRLNSQGEFLRKKMQSILQDLEIVGITCGVGSYNIPIYFDIKSDLNYRETGRANKTLEAIFSLGCINRGIFNPPRYCILSAALTQSDLEKIVNIMTEVLQLMSDSKARMVKPVTN